MTKIVLAFDSFKSCMCAKDICDAASQYISDILPKVEIINIPLSDGGEGMSAIYKNYKGGNIRHLYVHNPLMQKIQSEYLISNDNKTAIIESANAIGIDLLKESEKNPLYTSSYGVGEMIKDALDIGCRSFIIGLGGSSTNDGGIGMLNALNCQILDKDGKFIQCIGKNLYKICTIDTSNMHPALSNSSFTLICDVENTFCGKTGAAYTFGKQKGASEEQIKELDVGMYNLASIVKQKTGLDLTKTKSAGAAGGLSGASLAFLKAKRESGINFILDLIEFDKQIKGADLILTGEGCADKQTLYGKVPYGVLQRANKQSIPVVLIAGKIKDLADLQRLNYKYIKQCTPDNVSQNKALEPKNAKIYLQKAIIDILNLLEF